ncbi:hypothetical protein HanHA300_Chr02g0059671 [Helianthus annuus]|nr:hypothetical protein HanHA300_Chr02g0059671 [Helianthus annuus]KAJ0619166.1 hypothetical protein HanHA89_Chr02g0068291 [Helianthus annuus]KAJ0777615.1 hypothetical protein HanLR1_Chr02g0062511 [Helianthus annuus]KAJ0786644.1 hypothetical protein HanOQP8_Chr02g0073621 [Helianthus annuus]
MANHAAILCGLEHDMGTEYMVRPVFYTTKMSILVCICVNWPIFTTKLITRHKNFKKEKKNCKDFKASRSDNGSNVQLSKWVVFIACWVKLKLFS